MVPGEDDQRAGDGRIYSIIPSGHEFFRIPGAGCRFPVRGVHILFNRQFLGDLRHHDAACNPDGPCFWNTILHCGWGGPVRRAVRRPLITHIRHHHTVLHGRWVRPGGAHQDTAALCGCQWNHSVHCLYHNRIDRQRGSPGLCGDCLNRCDGSAEPDFGGASGWQRIGIKNSGNTD